MTNTEKRHDGWRSAMRLRLKVNSFTHVFMLWLTTACVTPLPRASRVLSTHINPESGLSLQGQRTSLMWRCCHMEQGGKGRCYWSINMHIIMHCCFASLSISPSRHRLGGAVNTTLYVSWVSVLNKWKMLWRGGDGGLLAGCHPAATPPFFFSVCHHPCGCPSSKGEGDLQFLGHPPPPLQHNRYK